MASSVLYRPRSVVQHAAFVADKHTNPTATGARLKLLPGVEQEIQGPHVLTRCLAYSITSVPQLRLIRKEYSQVDIGVFTELPTTGAAKGNDLHRNASGLSTYTYYPRTLLLKNFVDI